MAPLTAGRRSRLWGPKNVIRSVGLQLVFPKASFQANHLLTISLEAFGKACSGVYSHDDGVSMAKLGELGCFYLPAGVCFTENVTIALVSGLVSLLP